MSISSETTLLSNSCCHYDLSMIKKVGDFIQFPSYYLDDYYADLFDDFSVECVINSGVGQVSKDDIDWDTLYLAKTEAYSASVWYEQMKDFTYNSILIPINGTIMESAKDIIFPAFIKLDTVSSKTKYVFHVIEELVETFANNSRIQNTLTRTKITNTHYPFVREIDNDIVDGLGVELRCFVFHQLLVAVSGDGILSVDNQKIIDYVKSLIPFSPYNDFIVDIFVSNEEKITMIEINNFGADSPAGAGNYNWREDYFILHGVGDIVDFRILEY